MNVHRLQGLQQYVQRLQEQPHELDLLFEELLIGVDIDLPVVQEYSTGQPTTLRCRPVGPRALGLMATADGAVGVPAAFALSRERFPRREGVVTALLATQMVSPMILLVPIYGLVAGLRLLDTHAGLVLVYGSVQLPFTISVLKTFFDALPASVLEAARLDGASRLRTLWWIVLPLAAPGLAAVAIFDLASFWSEFSLALVLLDSQHRFTIPIGLFSFQSGYETDWHLVAAASFIGLVPVMAAFVLLQRYFVAGLTAGAVKG